MNFSSIYMNFFYVFFSFFRCILKLSSYGKLLSSCVYVIIYCVGAGVATLMSISDGSDPYLFPSKDGKDAVLEGRNGRKGVYFPPKSAFCLYK